MNRLNYIYFSLLILGLFSCDNPVKTGEKSASNLGLDHLVIWVKNPSETKNRLVGLGFTAVPDSLSEVHHGQGTSGRYINFLNAYLELIFVMDQDELEENNKVNSGMDFVERANYHENGASPFGIALQMNEYNTESIPFETVKYHQNWMEEKSSIYSAKNSKRNIQEPSVFVVYPEIESIFFESTSALDSFPSEDDKWKELFKHSNEVEKLTNVIITSTTSDLETETMKSINEIEALTVKQGKEHLMELFFDDNIQGKSFDLRPELPLIVNL